MLAVDPDHQTGGIGTALTKFALDASGVLTFENPAVRARYAEAPKGGYTASFARFDNGARTAQPVVMRRTSVW